MSAKHDAGPNKEENAKDKQANLSTEKMADGIGQQGAPEAASLVKRPIERA
jgi:hypothetical protein